MNTDSGDQTQKDGLPLLIVLFFNLVVLIILTVLFGRVPRGCVSPIGTGLSLAILALEFFHLTWRFLGKALLVLTVNVGPFAFKIGELAALFNLLHPWTLSNWILFAQAFIFFVIVGILWFPVSSQFSSDQVPAIPTFLVHDVGGDSKPYAPGSLLPIEKGTWVFVEAKTSDLPGISCTWSATKGTLLPAGGCATQYSTPVGGNKDNLNVLIQSPCKLYQTFAGLHVEIVQNEP